MKLRREFRPRNLALALLACLCLTGCATSWSSQQLPPRWTTGFWFWQGSDADAEWSGQALDVLFVQVGTIQRATIPYLAHWNRANEGGSVYAALPDKLPPARDYWFVFRFDEQGVPDLRVAPTVAAEASRLLAAAQRRGLHVAGIQLDIDSPTAALPRYATFLREVRKELPKGLAISITALLDWFRGGTSIDEAIAQVDEFVPQFYDLADPRSPHAGEAIAARIDAARWGPVFNRFRKRFRIGISTFGRARKIPREGAAETRYSRVEFFGDVAPIAIATQPAFQLQTSRNPANELVLSYRAVRKVRIGYNDFQPGDTVQFILATPEAVREAVESARRMQGYLAGVVFFRWPASNEALAMQPEEVLSAAGFSSQHREQRIQTVNGHCAAVECLDVYLEGADPFSPKPLRYGVRSSVELEYFVPETNMPVRMTAPDQLDVSLPPYCGRGRLYLGRAVSAIHSVFTVAEEQ